MLGSHHLRDPECPRPTPTTVTPVQRFLVVQVPSPLLALLFLSVAIGASLGAMWLVRRSTELETLESHKEVAGFIIAIIGALYSVLLAFVVASVWEQFEDAAVLAEREAEMAISLYRDASVFSTEAELRQSLRGYATSVVDEEWPAMAEHQREAAATDVALNEVFVAYRALEPQGPAAQTFLHNSLDRLDAITQARRERIAASSKALPDPLWLVLLFGAIVTIGFTLFLPVQSPRAQGFMVASLATMAALMLFVILSLDLPFTGDLATGPTAMEDAIAEFDDLDHSG
jgi:hypothetical protein